MAAARTPLASSCRCVKSSFNIPIIILIKLSFNLFFLISSPNNVFLFRTKTPWLCHSKTWSSGHTQKIYTLCVSNSIVNLYFGQKYSSPLIICSILERAEKSVDGCNVWCTQFLAWPVIDSKLISENRFLNYLHILITLIADSALADAAESGH